MIAFGAKKFDKENLKKQINTHFSNDEDGVKTKYLFLNFILDRIKRKIKLTRFEARIMQEIFRRGGGGQRILGSENVQIENQTDDEKTDEFLKISKTVSYISKINNPSYVDIFSPEFFPESTGNETDVQNKSIKYDGWPFSKKNTDAYGLMSLHTDDEKEISVKLQEGILKHLLKYREILSAYKTITEPEKFEKKKKEYEKLIKENDRKWKKINYFRTRREKSWEKYLRDINTQYQLKNNTVKKSRKSLPPKQLEKWNNILEGRENVKGKWKEIDSWELPLYPFSSNISALKNVRFGITKEWIPIGADPEKVREYTSERYRVYKDENNMEITDRQQIEILKSHTRTKRGKKMISPFKILIPKNTLVIVKNIPHNMHPLTSTGVDGMCCEIIPYRYIYKHGIGIDSKDIDGFAAEKKKKLKKQQNSTSTENNRVVTSDQALQNNEEEEEKERERRIEMQRWPERERERKRNRDQAEKQESTSTRNNRVGSSGTPGSSGLRTAQGTMDLLSFFGGGGSFDIFIPELYPRAPKEKSLKGVNGGKFYPRDLFLNTFEEKNKAIKWMDDIGFPEFPDNYNQLSQEQKDEHRKKYQKAIKEAADNGEERPGRLITVGQEISIDTSIQKEVKLQQSIENNRRMLQEGNRPSFIVPCNLIETELIVEEEDISKEDFFKQQATGYYLKGLLVDVSNRDDPNKNQSENKNFMSYMNLVELTENGIGNITTVEKKIDRHNRKNQSLKIKVKPLNETLRRKLQEIQAIPPIPPRQERKKNTERPQIPPRPSTQDNQESSDPSKKEHKDDDLNEETKQPMTEVAPEGNYTATIDWPPSEGGNKIIKAGKRINISGYAIEIDENLINQFPDENWVKGKIESGPEVIIPISILEKEDIARKIKEAFERKNVREIPIAEDGDCLFSCFKIILQKKLGRIKTINEIRKEVANHIVSNWEKYKPEITSRCLSAINGTVLKWCSEPISYKYHMTKEYEENNNDQYYVRLDDNLKRKIPRAHWGSYAEIEAFSEIYRGELNGVPSLIQYNNRKDKLESVNYIRGNGSEIGSIINDSPNLDDDMSIFYNSQKLHFTLLTSNNFESNSDDSVVDEGKKTVDEEFEELEDEFNASDERSGIYISGVTDCTGGECKNNAAATISELFGTESDIDVEEDYKQLKLNISKEYLKTLNKYFIVPKADNEGKYELPYINLKPKIDEGERWYSTKRFPNAALLKQFTIALLKSHTKYLKESHWEGKIGEKSENIEKTKEYYDNLHFILEKYITSLKNNQMGTVYIAYRELIDLINNFRLFLKKSEGKKMPRNNLIRYTHVPATVGLAERLENKRQIPPSTGGPRGGPRPRGPARGGPRPPPRGPARGPARGGPRPRGPARGGPRPPARGGPRPPARGGPRPPPRGGPRPPPRGPARGGPGGLLAEIQQGKKLKKTKKKNKQRETKQPTGMFAEMKRTTDAREKCKKKGKEYKPRDRNKDEDGCVAKRKIKQNKAASKSSLSRSELLEKELKKREQKISGKTNSDDESDSDSDWDVDADGGRRRRRRRKTKKKYKKNKQKTKRKRRKRKKKKN